MGRRTIDWTAAAVMAATVAAVVLLWDTPVVYPLKLLVVFLHEISHGLAAVLTGGRIIEIQLQTGEAGHTATAGGNAFAIYSAGYVGSLLFGALLLVWAARTNAERFGSAALGALLFVVTIRFVPMADNWFGKVFGAATGLLLVSLAFVPRGWAALGLRIVGVTSCLYAVIDIKSDVLDRPGADSDAARLAEITHVPALVWGTVWIVVSLAVAGAALMVSVTERKSSGVASQSGTLDG